MCHRAGTTPGSWQTRGFPHPCLCSDEAAAVASPSPTTCVPTLQKTPPKGRSLWRGGGCGGRKAPFAKM